MKKLINLILLLPILVSGQIILNERYAFPAGFGGGKDLTGGSIGNNYYAVTNLNNSGPGSFRDALEQPSGTTIIIKVEGLLSLTSDISGSTPDNKTIWGQFAPGRGLTISDKRITFEGASNWIVRHVTFQNKNNSGCPDPRAGGPNCRSAVAWRNMNQSGGLGVYIDHVSARWGLDQTLDIGHGQSTNRSTMAYTFLGQGHPSHNTGGFAGGIGDMTYARNAIVSISHRFAIHSGGNIENYNNYIVNYGSRIANARGSSQVDYFKNYVEKGNAGSPSQNSVNKMEGSGISGFRTYTADNYVEHIDETPNGLQTNLWQNRNGPEGPNFTPIDQYHYVSSRLNNFGAPADGEWDWDDVKANALASAGHNRGINADGSPGYFRDDIDEDFATRATNGTTRSSRLTAAQMYNSTFTGTSLYADTDGDYMPDWFENQHAHLDPNSSSDRDGTHVSWTFSEYTVTNNAGYTNLEIAAAFYAGDFETMITGKNDLTYTDPGGGGTIDVQSVSLDETNVTGEVSDTVTLTATISPSNADDTGVTWSTSNASLATVNSSGLVTHVAVASEIQTNGTFDTDSDWTKQQGWTISGGTASADGSATGNGKSIVQDMGIAQGRAYDITYTVTNYSGNGFKSYAGGWDEGPTHFANGTYTDRIMTDHPSTEPNVYIRALPGTVMEVDDVTVKEVPVITVTTDDGGHTARAFVTTLTPIASNPPVANIVGPEVLRLRLGETYTEFGCDCDDPEDGIFPATISGSVDTDTLGTYTITYSCDDSSGNPTVQATREVYVDSWPRQGKISDALWNQIRIYLNLGPLRLN